ncbi:hypothetical protein Tco_0060488 [Tanacetum coccineum]
MSSSNTSPRDYSRKHKREILEPWRQCHNLPPSPPSPPPNRTSPPLSPSNSLPISPPNSPIFDTTSLPPSPNSSNPTSSSYLYKFSTQNHSENKLHELLHLSNLLDIKIQHAIELTNRSPPPSPFTHPPFLDQGYVGDDDMEDDEEEDPDEDPEEEPIEQVIPEQNNMDGFASHPLPQPAGNMNGWMIEDDDEEVEEDRVDDKDDEEMEMDEDDEDNDGDDNEDEAEVINAYEEVDPLNRPPPTSDEETEFAPPVVPIVDVDDEPIPPVIQFGHNFHVGESLSARTLLEGNSWVHAPGPMPCDLKSVHRGVKRLDKQMFDRYKTEKKMAKKFKEGEFRMNRHEYDIIALDTTVRKNSSDHSEMKKFVLGLCRQLNELKEQNRRAERLSQWQAWVRGRIPTQLRFQEDPPIHFVYAPRAYDPYAMVRDTAMATREDNDDDTTTPNDLQPSEPRGSPRDP